MKKIVFCLIMALGFSAFAKTVDYETFCIRVKQKYSGVEYISYEVYENFNGDVDTFLKYLENNPQCYGEDESVFQD